MKSAENAMNPMNYVEHLRHAYQVWHDTRGASVGTWLELTDEDMVIRSLADGTEGLEFSSPGRGRADIERYLSQIVRDWQMLYFFADELIVQDDRVVMVGRCGWQHWITRKVAESPIVHLWRFRDG